MMKSPHSSLAHMCGGCILAMVLLLFAAGPAMAASLKGTVKNGTSNRAVPGAEVVLMELQHGMVPVAKVKTDSRGRFHFTNPAVGKEPMLLKTSYGGVSYYQSLAPGDATATIVVYQPTADPTAISVASHAIMLQPSGGKLRVEEQYVVENQTKPPVAYYASKGTFTFSLPDAAQLGQVSTWTAASHMPTLQNPIDAAKHRKAIDWAFRPGKSIVRINYLLPYDSNQATIHTQSPYGAMHVFLAVPPGVRLLSEGFNRIGSEEGFDIYARQSVPAETALVISVSGTASAPPASNSGNPSAGTTEAGVTTLPGRLHHLTWILATGMFVLLAAGTLFLLRSRTVRPAIAAVSGTENSARDADAEAAVHGAEHEQRLERIKEEFLQLELRHQAGTLGEEEYARERRRVEETIRSLLQG